MTSATDCVVLSAAYPADNGFSDRATGQYRLSAAYPADNITAI